MGKYFLFLTEEVEKLNKSLDNLEKTLEEAIRLREQYEYRYSNTRDNLRGNFERILLREAIREAQDDVIKIFEDEVNTALDSTREFNFPEFEKAFKSALWNNDKFIEFYMPNTQTLGVKINLESLGTLEDYVSGVKYAREVLGTESAERESARMSIPTTSKNPNRKKRSAPKMTPERASVYWKDYVYRGGQGGDKHSRTIDLRLKDFANKAPFWHILEDGTPLNLSSDWNPKGFPTPQTKPTRFVEKAAVRITQFIRATSKEFIERLRTRLVQELNRYEHVLSSLDHDIELLRELIAKWKIKDGEVDLIENARKKFDNLLQKQREQGARIEKIDELFKKIISGEVVSDRVYLGYGQRKRTTQLIKEVVRLIGAG